MSVETKEKAVMEMKKSFNEKAIFINLTDNETKLMNNVLRFSSYPTHFILAPGSNVIATQIGRLSQNEENNAKIADKIRNLIK